MSNGNWSRLAPIAWWNATRPPAPSTTARSAQTGTPSAPSASSSALNRIDGTAPSQIFGRLESNGLLYLINPNGILFGAGASVDVGGLVASTLSISDADFLSGLSNNINGAAAAFSYDGTLAGFVDSRQYVRVDAGAEITTGSGGRVWLFAKNVENHGSIRSPEGQTVLAAGGSIYLNSPTDNDALKIYASEANPNLPATRGLLVEVGDVPGAAAGSGDGVVTNALGAQISARTGNVSLVGLAVNQSGRVSATTTVRANGTVYLRAADRQNAADLASGVLTPTRAGQVTFGQGSVTQILPDVADTATTVDVNSQPRSRVEVSGHTIRVARDAAITAKGGAVELRAQADPSASDATLAVAARNDSRILIEQGARIDVSGANAALAADAHTVSVQLFSEQLRDSPLQRDGVLRGEEITVDLRQTGVRADGTSWVGTPLADVSGAIDTIQRGVAERSVTGGDIALVSQGDVLIEQGSTLDVSGGRVDYAAGLVRTTQLVSDGRMVDISRADPNRIYDGLALVTTRADTKFGQVQTWVTAGSGNYTEAYSEGADAGSVTINAPRFALDGTVRGSTLRGPLQRLPSQLPLPARLVVGYASGIAANPATFRTESIVFNEQSVLGALLGAGFDPGRDELPASFRNVLRPSLFAEDGVGRATVLSDGTIEVPEHTAMTLPTGGSLELRADSIDVAGDLTARGGSLTLIAQRTQLSAGAVGHDVTLRSGALLDVRGVWANDTVNGEAMPEGRVYADGGSVTVRSTNGDVVLGQGASVDASGGAWVRTDGSIRDGRGGSITLAVADAGNDSTLVLEGTVRAAALTRGGSLALTADAVCISASGCAGDLASGLRTLTLAPGFFEQGGFGSYAVTSKRGSLVVAADAAVTPRQLNYVLDGTYRDRATGSELADFARLAMLEPEVRTPTSITLATTGFRTPELRVETGSSIVTDPGATIALRSRTRLWIDGLLQSQGGRIEATLGRHPASTTFEPDQVVWVGSHAVLDASGTVRSAPDPLGRAVGNVSSGGTVRVAADRGYIVLEHGSTIDVSGDAATLDVQGSDGVYRRQLVASNAGSVEIAAAEAAVLEGYIVGRGGAASALGGEFSLTLDGNVRGEPSVDDLPETSNDYPHGPRVISVVPNQPLGVLDGLTYEALAGALPDRLQGTTRLGSDTIAGGGFDAVSLTARPLLTNDPLATGASVVRAPGVVTLAGNLAVGRRLVIDAPVIDVAAGTVRLDAPYVALGSTYATAQYAPAPVAAHRSLTVAAQWLDLVGVSAVSGADHVLLQSAGDLRLRPPPRVDANVRSLQGAFTTAGTLELQASQVYSSSLTEFTITATDGIQGTPGSIVVRSSGTPRIAPLSAGSTLNLVAARIEQRGVLAAPLGSINLHAIGDGPGRGELLLGADSLTSTSAAGSIIPLGRTEGGIDWIYDLANDQKLVLRSDLDPLPEQSIVLDGRAVSTAQGAVIDVSGGGDLQAHEFVPGVGGTRDVLDPAVSPNSFAIVPAYGATIGAYDYQDAQVFRYAPGTTVHLEGGNGLPAGEYVLLPARYALLPGAYLVTEQAGGRDLVAGAGRVLGDGTPVVAGRYGVAGTDQVESRARAFSIVSSTLLRDTESVRRPAEYHLTLGNEFFPAQAAEAGLARPRLPMDAGTVALLARELLEIEATLRGDAGTNGRGAALDIAADNLVVSADPAAAVAGAVAIDAGALEALGAESILLGGRRTSTAQGTSIEVLSDSVIVAGDASLTAPELLFAAAGQLTLQSGASVHGAGTASVTSSGYQLNGDGAFLRVAAGAQTDVTRDGVVGSRGSLLVEQGAQIGATGAVFMDSTRDVAFEGDLDLDRGSLAVSASTINVGAVPAGAGGFNLTREQLEALQGLDELLLRSRDAIHAYGDARLAAHSLQLDANGLVAHAVERGTQVAIVADSLEVTNSVGQVPPTSTAAGGGSLEVQAGRVVVGPGQFVVAGYDRVALSASHAILGRGVGGLSATNTAGTAALDLQAPVVSGEAGARTRFATQGNLSIGPASGTAEGMAGLGATLTFEGASVRHAGRIEATAGSVTLRAIGAGGVTLADGAVIDAGGATRNFGARTAVASAGQVLLEAVTGDVRALVGSRIDVAGAAAGGNAGTLQVRAPNGVVALDGDVDAAAPAGARGGRFVLDAREVQAIDALNARLNDAGFTAVRSLRLRQGDVDLGADIVAQAIEIVADGAGGTGGNVTLRGRLDADGAAGGSIRVAAQGDVVVKDGAALTARAEADGGQGGSIETSSGEGVVRWEAGARLDVSGSGTGRGGVARMQVTRQRLLAPDLSGIVLEADVVGAREIVVEGLQRYVETDGRLDAADVAAYDSQAYLDAAEFMQSAPSIADAIGRPDDATLHVRPGIEIASPGDLVLAADWELSSWRFGGETGYLTLRSAGDLRFDANLSDGYAPELFNFMEQLPGGSWSFRLAAGADLSSASALAVLDRAAGGSVLVGPGPANGQRAIRTGTGDIEVAAAADVRLANDRSVIYTMGTPVTGVSSPVLGFMMFEGLQSAALAEHGGRVVVRAGGDIVGQPSDQLVTDWLWRLGSLPGNDYPSPTAWGVDFNRFRQGIGALGGGSVDLYAGGDVLNVSAAVPTHGVPVGATQYDNVLDVRNGGDLTVEAAGDVAGGVYYVGRGAGRIVAGRDVRVGDGWSYRGRALHTTLALGAGSFTVEARRDLAIESVFNPTLLSPSVQQAANNPLEWLVDYSTYARDSSVRLSATAGDVLIAADTAALAGYAAGSLLFDTARRPAEVLAVLPPELRVQALSGSIVTGADANAQSRALALVPSASSTLELLAARDVRFVRAGYLLADSNPELLPAPLAPQLPTTDFLQLSLASLMRPFGPFAHAEVPVHSDEYAASSGYAGPREPARIVALEGDIDMSEWNISSQPVLWSSKPVQLVAGRDLVDPNVYTQNVEAADVSSFAAGRDVRYVVARDEARRIVPRASAMTIDGPGEVVLLAGRDVDLKASPGLVTRGDTANAFLDDEGASVNLFVGLGSAVPDATAFTERYLAGDDDRYAADLARYMQRFGVSGDHATLLDAFEALTLEQRLPLLSRILFAELRTRGRDAVARGDGDFSLGYDAIATLFPSLDPEQVDAGELSLFFSRIYTLDGGDIQAMVPGGTINVGLATPPAAFGVRKSPSQLGIVAQTTGDVNLLSGGDILVNQSRVFVADGGDVVMWSSYGNIDAGRGAKTAISAPPPVITYDTNGNATVSFPAALAGSGIRAFVTTPSREPGDVDLYAPTGIILVNDAGIGSAGNVTIGATQVVGVDNIDVGGVAVGVPVDTGGLSASLVGAGASSGNEATSAAEQATSSSSEQAAPMADAAMSWLEVFVVGLGEEACNPKDVDCLKRQPKKQ
jgi:filamentous hemagglutinin family protein